MPKVARPGADEPVASNSSDVLETLFPGAVEQPLSFATGHRRRCVTLKPNDLPQCACNRRAA
ncbi:protein of unknown function (plasmid) [Agrobacterium pusense]|uniref:Uncharacterized protein n=1 Tax=Agrobacterium pusense TaxID=648995 RepID=U4Q451_9HYPH|nr:protein of unknown function [Agrobacterium pusense]